MVSIKRYQLAYTLVIVTAVLLFATIWNYWRILSPHNEKSSINDSSKVFDFDEYIIKLEMNDWLDKLPQYLKERRLKLGIEFYADFLKYADTLKELMTAHLRQKKAARLVEDLRNNHFYSEMRNSISAISVTDVITSTCRFPKLNCLDDLFFAYRQANQQSNQVPACRFPQHTCNGLADRLRGTIVAFYLAIATNRVFRFDWLETSNIADYFLVNNYMYGVSKAEFDKCIAGSINSNHVRWMLHHHQISNAPYTAEMNRADFEGVYHNSSNLLIMSNRFAGLDGIFTNQALRTRLNDTMPTLYDSAWQVNDYRIAISAALQIIFARPNERMMSLLKQIISSTVGIDTWQNSFKIGVQLRSLIIDNQFGAAVTSNHLHCFITEIERTILKTHRVPWIEQMSGKYKTVIFVTSDWQDGAKFFMNNSKLNGHPEIATVFSLDNAFNFTAASHIDNIKESDWMLAARSFIDWYLLTRMDYLIISPSGFGIMASHMSLKPTKRYLTLNSNCDFYDDNRAMPYVQEVANVPTTDVI